MTQKRGFWTKENCQKEASKFQKLSEWAKKSPSSYVTARKNKWFEEVSQHMVKARQQNGFWTKEECLKKAKEFRTRKEWRENSPASYSIAQKNGWLKFIVKILPSLKMTWTLQACIKEASKYPTISAWIKGSQYSYRLALANGWLKQCIKHMNKKK